MFFKMQSTNLTVKKEFWAIIEIWQDAGFSGKESHSINLDEWDTATEMSEDLGELSVTAGESENTFYYRIVGQSLDWDRIMTISQDEERQKEESEWVNENEL